MVLFYPSGIKQKEESIMKRRVFFATVLLSCFFLTGRAHALSIDVEGVAKGNGFLSGFGDQLVWSYVFEPILEIGRAQVDLYFEDEDKDFSEFAFLKIGDNHFSFHEIDTGVMTFEVDPQELFDRAFDVRIISLWGDFFSPRSVLRIETVSAAPVPEPATILLFGSGLLGIALLSKRRALAR